MMHSPFVYARYNADILVDPVENIKLPGDLTGL
jgi:hypothetical protein